MLIKKYSLEYNVKARPRILLKEEIQVSLITQRAALWGLSSRKNLFIKDRCLSIHDNYSKLYHFFVAK